MIKERKFYQMSLAQRLSLIASKTNLTKDEISTAVNQALSFDKIDKMVENAIGVFSLPLGIATNFLINGKDYLVPMAIEEPSVVAAASHSAKLAKSTGGFNASADSSIMRGQIQVINVSNFKRAMGTISKSKDSLLSIANSCSKNVRAVDLKTRVIKNEIGKRKMPFDI